MPVIDFKSLLLEAKQARRREIEGSSTIAADVDDGGGGDDDGAGADFHPMVYGLAKSRENLVEARHVNKASLAIPYEIKMIDLEHVGDSGINLSSINYSSFTHCHLIRLSLTVCIRRKAIWCTLYH